MLLAGLFSVRERRQEKHHPTLATTKQSADLHLSGKKLKKWGAARDATAPVSLTSFCKLLGQRMQSSTIEIHRDALNRVSCCIVLHLCRSSPPRELAGNISRRRHWSVRRRKAALVNKGSNGLDKGLALQLGQKPKVVGALHPVEVDGQMCFDKVIFLDQLEVQKGD